jgi:hypothetical protein
MRNTTRTVIAGSCLLVGLMVAVARGQVSENAQFMNTGLFQLTSGAEVNLYVSLDDNPGGPPAKVLLQAFDEAGTSVARREVVLGVGQSTTLRVVGPGRFRGHATITELSSGPLTERRTAAASAEINDGGMLRHVCFVTRSSHDPTPIR